MFSMEEKRKISNAVEQVLLEINHPEMPKRNPIFKLHVEGKEEWSWANIEPNSSFNEERNPSTTQWNENARKHLKA